MEYYKNLDLKDIVYWCDVDLIWKTEQWKGIKGYEFHYEVSDLGRVKSLSRPIVKIANYFDTEDKILKLYKNTYGYIFLRLCKEGVSKGYKIHQLVAQSFLGFKICGMKMVINHKNFNRSDNKLSNLEIVTQRVNSNRKHLKSSSIYTGVSFFKLTNKWRSAIKINGKLIHLGYFLNEIEASDRYKQALVDLELGNDIVPKKIVPDKILKKKKKKKKQESKYPGVSFDKKSGKWVSKIWINTKNTYLKKFKTEIEAHKSYQNALLSIN